MEVLQVFEEKMNTNLMEVMARLEAKIEANQKVVDDR
jgi:hypothetical protein